MLGEFDCLACALEYAARGWPVFPLIKGQKEPHGEHARHGFLDATTDALRIKAWWSADPEDGIGLAAGWRVRNGHVGILDIDPRNGGTESLAKLEAELGGPLPKTVVARTGGGGGHYYLWTPYLTKKCKLAEHPGIDWIPQDGYVVLPPSLHPSGARYEWVEGLAPHQVDIAEIPLGLLALLAACDAVIPKPRARRVSDVATELPPARLAVLRSALFQIDADCARDIWIQCGMALEAEHAGLFDLWDEWSATGKAKYPGTDELQRQWASFCRKDEEVTLKSVFFYAQQAGWRGGFEENANGFTNAWLPSNAPQASWLAPEWVWSKSAGPVFPLASAYPERLWQLREWGTALAHTFQMPLDFPCVMSLAMACGASGGNYVVTIAGYQWREPLALWTVCAMPSGMGKSPVFAPLIAPFQKFERALREDELFAAFHAQLAFAEIQVNASLADMKRKGKAALDDQAMQAALVERHTKVCLAKQLVLNSRPHSSRMLVSDLTSEALAEFLEDHHGRALVADPEGGVFDLALGSASRQQRLDVWLKSFSAETISEKRVGNALNPRSKERYVRAPMVSIAVATQPKALVGMLGNEMADAKGFLARFLPVVVPSILPTDFMRKGMLPTELVDWWETTIRRLLSVQRGEEMTELVLSDEAAVLFETWGQTRLDHARSDSDAKADYLTAWNSKLRGKALRIAATLHVMAEIRPATKPIAEDCMQAALAWMPYFEGHQTALSIALRIDPIAMVAERVLRWIARQPKAATQRRRTILRGMRASNEELIPAIDMLVEYGWLKPVGKIEVRRGRLSCALEFEVHPEFGRFVPAE